MERLLHNIEGSLKKADPRYHISELKFLVCNKGQGFVKKKGAYLKEIISSRSMCLTATGSANTRVVKQYFSGMMKRILSKERTTSDAENATVEPEKMERLLHNIEGSFKRADLRYHIADLKFSVCNKGHDFIKKKGAYLKENHFIKIDVPYRYRKCQYPGYKTVLQLHDDKKSF
ncbi:unnamed protein product [Thlaspi arvense]|uniref:Uncharacterized protein n=1 Tax=Thlaspi arvense TaxID=13288 RepID=A0AAU9SKX9_THLAR|nr:unnamed protein product [Thlaspi arvense]